MLLRFNAKVPSSLRARWVTMLASYVVCGAGCTLLVDSETDGKPRSADVAGDAASELDSSLDPDAGADTDASGRDGGPSSRDGDPGDDPGGDGGTAGDAGDFPPDADGATAPNADVKLCLGRDHGCGLKASGELVCWGDNSQEQTELPTNRKYREIACGTYHTCGIDYAGALVCVGRNADGQRASAPGPYAQVTAGNAHTCVLDGAGNATCFGRDISGQASPPSNTTFKQLSAGDNFTCGIVASNESLLCWGDQYLTALAKGKRLARIDAAASYVCGMTTDGVGDCWGDPAYVPPPMDEVKAIAGGVYQGCALSKDGALSCWYGGEFRSTGQEDGRFSVLDVADTGLCAVPVTGPLYCFSLDGGPTSIAPGPNGFP